jgi:hypothetical protein
VVGGTDLTAPGLGSEPEAGADAVLAKHSNAETDGGYAGHPGDLILRSHLGAVRGAFPVVDGWGLLGLFASW